MSELLSQLNIQQQNALKCVNGAIIVSAGAGSGKTKLLTSKVAFLLENNYCNPYEILAITFTNKAANEMKERICNFCGNVDIWISTFHSMCAKILRNEIENTDYGRTRYFTIYNSDDKTKILKSIIKDMYGKGDDVLLSISENALSQIKNQYITIEEWKKANSTYSYIDDVIKIMISYTNELKNSNAFDFDDLLYYSVKMFNEYKDLLYKYSNRFKYINVDEFQDTNTVQYLLIKQLSSVHKNIFIVGDEDQSIYGWRGANIENISSFFKDFENVNIFKLEQNYRSTKNILNLANNLIKLNQSHIEKKLWTENTEGVKPELKVCYNEKEEADYVVESIYNLTHNSGYEYKDIAILMRINALSLNFESKLLGYNIPYKIYGGFKFFDRAEIKDMLAYLKLLSNSNDNASFLRIINVPKRGLGDTSMQKLRIFASETGKSLFSCIDYIDECSTLQSSAKVKLKDFKKIFCNIIEESKNLSIPKIIENVFNNFNLKDFYFEQDDKAQSKLMNIDSLIKNAFDFETDNEDATLQTYLESVSLISDIDSYDSDNNSVTLATVHSVKGLEFKVVFIVGVEQEIFPIIRECDSICDLEEERRLMYVAITRAEQRLYLTYTKNRYMYGHNDFYRKPSQFIAEMGLFANKNFEQSNNNTRSTVDNFNNYSNNFNAENVTNKTSIKNNDINIINLFVGKSVKHAKFGIGTIISLTGTNANQVSVINFEKIGNKTLLPYFAGLKEVDDE